MAGKIPVEKPGPAPSETIGGLKKTVFSIIFGVACLLAVIPIEIGLRIADFGIDTRAFITPGCMDDIYITNIGLFKKYYPRRPLTKPDKVQDMMAANIFPRDKADGTLRGFVIGGSTAQGFPYQRNQSFSKITEIALAAGGKYDKVEVLNLGLSAITSYCVRDMASKLLRYQPDFLVIYAGHNEYYGTISNTTGGGFLTKNFYLALNEWRIFQLLFNIQNKINPSQTYDTLMEEQFSRKRPLPKNERDQVVAADFIKNIDAVVKTYQKRKIPVVIIEPVSNLCDMPPFSGEKDSEFSGFIQAYAEVIKGGNNQELEQFYRNRMRESRYDCNANVRFLDAKAVSRMTGKAALDEYRAAKDLDILPFRAREILVKNLRKYCHDQSVECPDLFYVPLGEIMARTNGPAAFGNDLFVDHLHFTQKGQRAVSRILAEQIAAIFNFNETEKDKVATFYQEAATIEQAIHYLPVCRTEVYRKICSLTGIPPFNQMLIPYHRNDVDGLNESHAEQGGMALIRKSLKMNMDPTVVSAAFYVNRGRPKEGKAHLDAYLWMFPGNYRPYLVLARFKMVTGHDIDDTFSSFETAYLFSGKMKSIYEEIYDFLEPHARQDLLAEIEKYGKPIE